MPEYRRYFVAGGTYFFTVVTAGRAPLFGTAAARTILGNVMREEQAAASFATVAVVLLPDHLHAVWTLPAGDAEYSSRWQAIKARFTSRWLDQGGQESRVSEGYQQQRRRGVWQPRFIEHTIRDEQDLRNHADYIHYNPVKHGHARRPWDWVCSSFRRYVASGDYPRNWGDADLPSPDFGGIDEELLE